jgi:hypothetical protein
VLQGLGQGPGICGCGVGGAGLWGQWVGVLREGRLTRGVASASDAFNIWIHIL